MEASDPTEILNQAIAVLQQAAALLERMETHFNRFEQGQQQWVDKHAASLIVCKHWKTLDKWRRDETKALIEGLHWQHDGGEITYNAPLLKDWYTHRHDSNAHTVAIELYQASLPSNQRKRRRSA